MMSIINGLSYCFIREERDGTWFCMVFQIKSCLLPNNQFVLFLLVFFSFRSSLDLFSSLILLFITSKDKISR